MEHVLLVRFGELYLKGLNRPYFCLLYTSRCV